MISDLVKRFSKKAPVALMFRGLFDRVFDPGKLDAIFEEHRVNQKVSPILFSALCDIVHPVVIGVKPSVHASFIEKEEDINGSKQAMYEKLAGVEESVCNAFLEVPTRELQSLLEAAKATKADIIEGYHAYVIDGKRINATQHRLKSGRVTNSAPLPGTVLAMLDTRVELFHKVRCSKDGYANERTLCASMFDEIEVGALYMADRNFSDGKILGDIISGSAFFVIRQHGRSPSRREINGQDRVKVGVDDDGQSVYEQAIEVYLTQEKRWQKIRRVTVELKKPTRDGDTEIHVLTNLPAKVKGVKIVQAYRKRWRIETCFGRVAMSLNAEINTLAYPGASLFCFINGLIAFNLISALKQLVARFNKTKKLPELSDYYLALEISESKLALEICFDTEVWDEIRAMSTRAFLAWFKAIAEDAKYKRYRKHKRGPKRPQPKRKSGKRKKHFSTQRALENA